MNASGEADAIYPLGMLRSTLRYILLNTNRTLLKGLILQLTSSLPLYLVEICSLSSNPTDKQHAKETSVPGEVELVTSLELFGNFLPNKSLFVMLDLKLFRVFYQEVLYFWIQ